MANWDVCFSWLLSDEDPADLHATTKDNCPSTYKDPGPCFAISGVNSGAWPQDFAFINSLPQDQRATAVQAFYYKHFWNSYVAQVSSDDVAKRWLDMAVNGGEGTSTKLLQQAVNSFHVGNPLNIDGRLGPATVVVVNAVNPLTLVAAFQNQRVAYYETVAAKNPADAKYLPAWLARARK